MGSALLKAVFRIRIRIRMDPHIFRPLDPDPDPHFNADPDPDPRVKKNS